MLGNIRLIFVTRKYAATLAYYRDGLELPIVEAWNHGLNERGVEFQVGSGTIQFTSLAPESGYTLGLSTNQQGVSIGIEVADIETWYRRARENGLEISQDLGTFPWGERGFTLVDPNGIGVYVYSVISEDGNPLEEDRPPPFGTD